MIGLHALSYKLCRGQCLVLTSMLNTHACAWVQKMASPCIIRLVCPGICKPKFTHNLSRVLCWLELHCLLLGSHGAAAPREKLGWSWDWVFPSEMVLEPEQESFLWNTPSEPKGRSGPWDTKVSPGEMEPGKVIARRSWASRGQSWKSWAVRS